MSLLSWLRDLLTPADLTGQPVYVIRNGRVYPETIQSAKGSVVVVSGGGTYVLLLDAFRTEGEARRALAAVSA